jgi:hypothetical protein
LGGEEGRGFKAVVRTVRPELEMEFVGSEAPRKTEESRRLFDKGRRQEVTGDVLTNKSLCMTQLVEMERRRKERAQT